MKTFRPVATFVPVSRSSAWHPFTLKKATLNTPSSSTTSTSRKTAATLPSGPVTDIPCVLPLCSPVVLTVADSGVQCQPLIGFQTASTVCVVLAIQRYRDRRWCCLTQEFPEKNTWFSGCDHMSQRLDRRVSHKWDVSALESVLTALSMLRQAVTGPPLVWGRAQIPVLIICL